MSQTWAQSELAATLSWQACLESDTLFSHLISKATGPDRRAASFAGTGECSSPSGKPRTSCRRRATHQRDPEHRSRSAIFCSSRCGRDPKKAEANKAGAHSSFHFRWHRRPPCPQCPVECEVETALGQVSPCLLTYMRPTTDSPLKHKHFFIRSEEAERRWAQS